MTVDEALGKLEDNIRRVKIEYEAYFNGGLARPPHDTVFRIESAIKKYSSEAANLNFSQRFKFNQLAQKYAVYNDLWRKKLRVKEEGLDRLPLTAGRVAPRQGEGEERAGYGSVHVVCSDPEMESDKVDELLKALIRAKSQIGEPTDDIDPEVFTEFVREKTRQFKQSLGCKGVEFSVSVEAGKVKFRAAKP